MSRDPWKRAYRMSKSSAKQTGKGSARPPRGPASVPLVLGMLILLPALVGIGMIWYAWNNRGTLLPEYGDEMPEQFVRRIDIPPRQVDLQQLDSGLGIGIAIFGSQGEVLRNTREWGIEWTLTALGSERLRLEARGVTIIAAGDVIESYVLDMDDIYQHDPWEPWFADLRSANVEQQLNLREVQGDEELKPGKTIIELTGPTSLQYAGNWRHPAYELEFHEGWLEELRAGMAIGAAIDESTDGRDG